MKIYNTLSQEKENINKDKKLELFVCGPTVYDFSHIGHARTYLAFDIVVRYLRSRGFKIEYIQNITDIDDKIINRAKEEGKDPLALSEEFKKEYYQDMETLGIESVDEYIKASDVMPEIINQVQTLVDNGFAYETPTGVYFKVRKFKDYGKLSNQDIDELQSGSRVEVNEEKEDPLDFVVWKKPKEKPEINEPNEEPVVVNGEPLWNSPWGWGRPGWHIEDTAISESKFGPQYDIHGGAEDLKFPHHESEIAQQEAASGKKPFVKIWMHAGFLMIDGQKMGKSLGNFTTIREFLKDHSPRLLRWMVISNHYRSKLNYTQDLINQAEESLNHIENFLTKLTFISQSGKNKETKQIAKELENMTNSFHTAMADDFNTPKAISTIFKFMKNLQDDIWHLKKNQAKEAHKTIIKLMGSLGLEVEDHKIPSDVQKTVQKREKLRSNEQFVQADELRNKLIELGYEIEDTPLGAFVSKDNYKTNGKK